MKVEMLETAAGSENGWETSTYLKGREYVLGESLAKAFIESGAAKAVSDQESTAGRKPNAKQTESDSAPPDNPKNQESRYNGGAETAASRKRGGK